MALNHDPEVPIGINADLEDVLSPRTVVEHANHINSSQSITSYYYNSTNSTTIEQTFNDLAPNWDCNQVNISVSNLYENRTWLQDPGFEYTGNWSEYNTSRLDQYGDWTVEIADGVGMNSSKGVHIKLNRTEDGEDTSAFYSFVTEAGYVQELSINRSDINWAGIDFNYKVDLDSTWSLETAATYSLSVEIKQDKENYYPDKYYTYWSYMDQGIPDIELLNSHDVVIWDCGLDISNTLTTNDRTLLENYLNNEGKLFLTGSGIAYDSSTSFDTWLNDYLHADYQGFHLASEIDDVSGPAGSLYEDYTAIILYNGADHLDAIGGGEICMQYDGSGVNPSSEDAAVNWTSATDNNATVFFAFSYEYLLGKNNRTNIMNTTLNYLNSSGTSVLVIDDGNNEYGYYHADALEKLGFERIWKRVYTKPFFQIEEENVWYDTGIVSIPLQYLTRNSTHINLEIKIGIKHAGSLTKTPDPFPEIWIDNFDLYLQSEIEPSVINLTMNDLQPLEEDVGTGNYSQTFTSPLTNDIVISNFTWDPNPYPDPEQDFYITFDCTSTISCSKDALSSYFLDPNQNGVNLNVNSGENASWNFYYWNIIPTGYEDHYLNISKPLDWNVTFVAAPLEQSVNVIENCSGGGLGSSFLIVPTQNITSFHDGYWLFNATSFNYHNDLKIQAWNGTGWDNQTEYFVGNKSRVMVQVLNSTGVPPDLSTFSANLTIIDPQSNIWYYNETFYSASNGIIYFPNITVNGSDTYGGVYDLNAAWTNGEEIFYKSTSFTIKHEADLILYKPTDAQVSAETTLTHGDLLQIKMRLNDTDRVELISGSNLTLNWTNGGPTIQNFTDSGTGEYQLTLDTAELPTVQNYTLIINSTNQYYSNDTYSLKLIVLADTVLTSPHFPRVSEPWGDNITINYFYNESISGTGIPNADYVVEYSGAYTMYDLTNGHYQLELNTTSVAINEHLVNVSFEKPNFFQQNLTIRVNIHEKETKLLHDTINAVPKGDNATIVVTYSTLDNTPIAPDGDPENVISINGTSIFNVTYNELGSQKYRVTLNTSSLGDYDLINITAQKNKYYSQSLLSLIPYRDIFLEIVPLNATFIELPNNVTYTNFSVYLNDTEHNLPVDNAPFSFMGFNEINATFVGNGTYKIMMNSGNVAAQPYNVLITASPTNYLQDSLQITLLVKNWTNFYDITPANNTVQTITQGSSITLELNFYNSFLDLNETDTVYYSWTHGSGTLTGSGNGDYHFDISSSGIPAGTYEVLVFINNSEGIMLDSQTYTIVMQAVQFPLPWYVEYAWLIGLIIGILAASIGTIALRYSRQKAKERGWEKKINHLYVFHSSKGAPLFDRQVGEATKLDSSLITSALLGISSLLSEIMTSKRKIKSIDHMDKKIIFSHGYKVTAAIMSSIDLPIIRKKLNEFTQQFENHFKTELKEYMGEAGIWGAAKKMVNQIFPFTKLAQDLEITSRWAIDKVMETQKTTGMEVLKTISLGLKDPDHISAGTGVSSDKVIILMRLFRDLNLLDKNFKLTKKGNMSLKIYNEQKEEYLKIKKIIERNN